MNILITGAGGFFAQGLIKKLKKKNLNIIGITSKKFKNSKNLKYVTCKNIFHLKKKKYIKLITNSDIIINTAWYTNPKDYLKSKKNKKCYLDSVRLANLFKNNTGKFISIGSCIEYKKNRNKLRYNSNLKSTNNYSFYKIKSFKKIKKIFEGTKVKFIWPRIFFLYGSKVSDNEQSGRLFPIIRENIKNRRKTIINNSHFVRDFISLQEAVNQFINIIYHDHEGATNICTGNGITVKKLCLKHFSKNNFIFLKKSNSKINNSKIVGKKYL